MYLHLVDTLKWKAQSKINIKTTSFTWCCIGYAIGVRVIDNGMGVRVTDYVIGVRVIDYAMGVHVTVYVMGVHVINFYEEK